MGKIDKVKEFIGYLKVILGMLVAIDISMIAWIFKYVETLSLLKSFFVLFVVIAITVAIIVINKKILNKIDELEEL